MSADFDPYFKWLGIPPEEQPPTHYRLLAIPVFTSDPEVIENAADQRMAHLRSVQSGQRAALAQALLNQIAMAKVCLLDHGQRATYDQQLRAPQRLAESLNVVPPPVQVVVDPMAVVGGENQPVGIRSRRNVPKRSSSVAMEIFKIIAGGIAGLAVGYLLICWISPRNDFLNLFVRANEKVAESPPLTPAVDEQAPARTSKPANIKPVPSRPTTQEPSIPVVPKVEPPAAPLKVEPPAAPLVVEASETIAEMQGRLEQRRDAAAIKGDLIEALNVVDELAKLNGTNSLAAKLSFLSTWNAETAPSRRTVAAEMLKLLDLAVAEKQFDLTAQHVDRLLVLARTLDDRELERRATMIALKRPSEPSTGPKPAISPATMNTTPDPEPSTANKLTANEKNASAKVDKNWDTLITNLDTFRLHWKSGDNRGTYLYDDQANAIVIDSVYNLGTISDSQPWSEFYFEIAAKKLSSDRLDIQINGVTFKVGPAVKPFPNGTPVRIVFVEDKSQAIAIVGDNVASRVTISDDKWRSNFQCTFSSNGGSDAQIRLTNIRLRRPSIK